MAEQFVGRDSLYSIGDYTIQLNRVLGFGAQGIVFQGYDRQGQRTANKRMVGNINIENLSDSLDRLKALQHRNIVQILHFERSEDALWIFMPLSNLGDLNQFYRENEVSFACGVDIMTQIAAGLNYLYGKNIVHRDIKPGNILIFASDSLLAKLADFDVSKYLDPDFETSVMSTNVGTLAFKAPEFFLRVAQGIRYHRNVDVYALGLTFLAMLQAKRGNNFLIPRVETTDDYSEMHDVIGNLIAVRVKYSQPNLSIIGDNNGELDIDSVYVLNEREKQVFVGIKQLIGEMTQLKPEERCTPAYVENELLRLCSTEVVYAQNAAIAVQSPPQIWLRKDCSYETRIEDTWSMRVNSRDQLLLRGLKNGQCVIKVIDKNRGSLVKEFRSLCAHFEYCRVMEHPTDPGSLVEVCTSCKKINAYSIEAGVGREAYAECADVQYVCRGPGRSILVIDRQHQIKQLEWSDETEKFDSVKTLQLPQEEFAHTSGAREMRYSRVNDVVIIVAMNPGSIRAFRLTDGECIWRLINGEGITTNPTAVTCDSHGRVYVGDSGRYWLLVMDSHTGKILKRMKRHSDIGFVWDVCWEENQPQLVVRFNNQTIYCYETFEI